MSKQIKLLRPDKLMMMKPRLKMIPASWFYTKTDVRHGTVSSSTYIYFSSEYGFAD